MGYIVETITQKESDELRSKYSDFDFSAKADLNGICVELFTSDRDHIDMWEDNFYSVSDHIRSHARLFCIYDDDIEMKVLVDVSTFTAFLFNFDYYGWIKSIGLGMSGLILEAAHDVFSIHGAAISVDGVGVTLIAPSKTGKTTQSWGLLRMKNACLISDDWYYVTLGKGRPSIRGSEKNCYIDADIGDVWEEFKPLIKNVKFDNRGRGIANVRWVTGTCSVIQASTMRYVILMKRDHDDPEAIRKLTTEEAFNYMVKNDFCNPHQILRDDYRMGLRKDFFREFFGSCEVYMINTIKSPQETQELIRGIVKDVSS